MQFACAICGQAGSDDIFLGWRCGFPPGMLLPPGVEKGVGDGRHLNNFEADQIISNRVGRLNADNGQQELACLFRLFSWALMAILLLYNVSTLQRSSKLMIEATFRACRPDEKSARTGL